MESLRIDLGCGPRKSPGFVGVDREAMPGVDIVADLNSRLPFEDDSVDLVVASHSLEHVADLMATMRELYRICKHGAQVCIVAPYHEQKLNVANPYHIVPFNEHTARFLTTASAAGVNAKQYWHPHAPAWGLAESDHSSPGVDFRLAKLEFFYFPAFLGLSEEEKLYARRHLWDVCDQMLCQLVVWKKPDATDEEIRTTIEGMEFFEPAYVTERREADVARMRDGTHGEMLHFGALPERVGALESRMGETVAKVEVAAAQFAQTDMQLAELHHAAIRADAGQRATALELAQVHQKIENLAQEGARMRALVENQQASAERVNKELETAKRALDSERREHTRLRDMATQQATAVDKVKATLELQSRYLHQAWGDALALSHENGLQRNRKLMRLISVLRPTENLATDLPEPFRHLLATLPHGARVVIGDDLRGKPFNSYRETVPVDRPGKLEIGVHLPVKNLGDTVGVEVVSAQGSIVFHEAKALDQMWLQGPVRFSLDGVRLSKGDFVEVRLFSRDPTSSVYPMEVRIGRWSRARRVLIRWY